MSKPVKRPSLLKRFVMRFQRQAAFSAFLPASRYDWQREVGDGWDSSVVSAPLGWLCRTFPESPLMAEQLRDGSWEMMDSHPAVDLLHRPNPFFSGELLWMATILSLYADGNAYWIKAQDAQLRTIELWWVPTALMEPKWPRDGGEFISHYEYKPDTNAIRLEVDQVVHFRMGIDPNNIRKGLSPLKAVLREIASDNEASNFAASLLRNMGVPGLIVSPDGDAVVEDDDLDDAKNALAEHFTGDRRGKPFVAGAPTKVQQFGFNPQQMDMRTLRRLPEERVTAAIGVPAIVAGLGAGLDRSTFANMAEAREMAYESTIIPLQRIVLADLNHQLMVDFEPDLNRVRLRFDLSDVRVLQEDENKKIERKLKELSGGAITVAEYRRETGRDAGPEHDVYLRPFSVVEVPVGGLPAVEPKSSAAPKRAARSATKATRAQQELMRELLRKEQHWAGVFTSELNQAFMLLGEDAEREYLELVGKSRKTAHEDEALADLITARMRNHDFNREALKGAFEGHYTRVMDDTVQTVNDVISLGVSLPDETARRIVAEGGKRVGLIDIDKSTRSAIFRSLEAGRAAGEGPREIARRIRDEVPAGRFTNAGPQYRSQLIARTETKYAQNVSAMEAYRESPVVTGLLAFDAQGSGDSDPECMSRDGMTFTFEEADVELATEHPNGTLSFAPVMG